MEDLPKYRARDILDSFNSEKDTNTYNQSYLYAPDAYRYGGFPLNNPDAIGGYNKDTHSLGFRNGIQNISDVLAHEAGHYDNQQRLNDLGTPNSWYMPSEHPNKPEIYSDRKELLNTLQDLFKEHYTQNYPLGFDQERKKFYATGSNTPDIPSNLIENFQETVAGLRGLHGGQKYGTTYWDTKDGKQIKQKLDSKFTDTLKSRKILDSLMFPQARFLDEAPPISLLDRFKNFIKRK